MARPRDITSRAPTTCTVGPSVDVAPALGEPARVADEGDLCRLWAARAFPADALVAADGAAVRVIYPGRRTGTGGPDFRDAILADGSGRVRAGDVEVHLRSRDWVAHGHRADPAYNKVPLQEQQTSRGGAAEHRSDAHASGGAIVSQAFKVGRD